MQNHTASTDDANKWRIDGNRWTGLDKLAHTVRGVVKKLLIGHHVRQACVVTALVLGAGAYAATAARAAEAPAPSQLNVAWPTDLGPLNPHGYSPNQMMAQGMVYEPLVKYQADGSVIPWLAESWSISEDGRSYQFELRQNVLFANGEPFDAEAVRANIEAVLANRERHSWLELANQIQQVEVLGSHTVVLHLNDAYYPTLQELGLPRPFRFLAPSQFVEGGTTSGIKAPVGTGPWQLLESSLGEYYLFGQNPHYWGAAPHYDQVQVKVIPDPNSRAIALETGVVDLVIGANGPLPPDMFQRFEQQGKMTTLLSQPYETVMLALNTARGPTQELAVRQAINHAVDKDTLVRSILHDTHQRADTLFSPQAPYANLDLPAYRYDPERAATLLNEAGWQLPQGSAVRKRDGEHLELELVFLGTDAQSKAMAEVVQADLARVGVAVQLVAAEESSLHARQRDGSFNLIFSRTWGAPYDPHAFVSSMRVPVHADYQAQLGLPNKAELDAAITAVLVNTDESERRQQYRDILTNLHEAAVYLPLTHVPAMAVARANVADIGFGSMSSQVPFHQFRPLAE